MRVALFQAAARHMARCRAPLLMTVLVRQGSPRHIEELGDRGEPDVRAPRVEPDRLGEFQTRLPALLDHVRDLTPPITREADFIPLRVIRPRSAPRSESHAEGDHRHVQPVAPIQVPGRVHARRVLVGRVIGRQRQWRDGTQGVRLPVSPQAQGPTGSYGLGQSDSPSSVCQWS